MPITSIPPSVPSATAQRRHVRQARRIAIELHPFELTLLIEVLERHARHAAANPETLSTAVAWFSRCDELREAVQ